MGQDGIPLSLGVIIAAAILGGTFIVGMVLLAMNILMEVLVRVHRGIIVLEHLLINQNQS